MGVNEFLRTLKHPLNQEALHLGVVALSFLLALTIPRVEDFKGSGPGGPFKGCSRNVGG